MIRIDCEASPLEKESELSDGKVNGQELFIIGTVGQLGFPEMPAIKCQWTVNSIPSLLKSSPILVSEASVTRKIGEVVDGCISIVASATACFEV